MDLQRLLARFIQPPRGKPCRATAIDLWLEEAVKFNWCGKPPDRAQRDERSHHREPALSAIRCMAWLGLI
jgi:hypothetical protein